MTDAAPTLGVGMVGYAFMGAVHSQAWRTAGRFFDLPLAPAMTALCGRDPAATSAAAARMGWASVESDWKQMMTRDDIQLVDICTPGNTHAEIAIAALEAGKHVLCEKPLANSVAEAEAMVAAAEAAQARGVFSMVGFNYRRVPAIALARQLVEEGRLGTIRHVRAQYLQDWIVDPAFPLVWRLQKDKAGSGALGDVGAHIIDLAQFVVGSPISGVTGLTETFVRERPLPEESSGLRAAGGAGTGQVTVDDAALFLARFGSGALGSFEATRFASGRKNALRLEINGVGRQHRLRLRVDERAAVPRPHRGRPRRRVSGASSSPSRLTPTPTRGGPRATGSATSTPSPTRWSTWSRAIGEGRPPVAVVRRRAAGAAGARRRRTLGGARQRLGGRRWPTGTRTASPSVNVAKQPGLAAL